MKIFIVYFIAIFSQAAIGQDYTLISNEVADEAAVDVADELAAKLQRERSTVVFVDIASCDVEGEFCQAFSGRFNSSLINEGIRFLPQARTEEIRKQIVEEQVYQLNSKMVDVKKAVALGKQDAFHAFVTISISGGFESGYVNINTQSVNIRSANVSVSIFKRVTIIKERKRSWSLLLGGSLVVGAGLYGAYHGHEMVLHHKKLADEAYTSYQGASDVESTTLWRKKSEEQDEKARQNSYGRTAGLTVAAIGIIYILAGSEDTLSYDIADNRRADSTSRIALAPTLGAESYGFSLVWKF